MAFIALLGATPLVSLAQVWSMGSNGQMGYHGTPNPVSPNCVSPQVWTLTNGHYACQNPPPPPGGGGGAYDPVANCATAMAGAGFTVHNHYATYVLSTGNIDDRFGADGPEVSDVCGNTTTAYTVDCVTSPSTKQVLYLAPAPALPGASSCSGPN